MVEKLCNYIEKERLLNGGETVILAVSGGADSLCLLNLFFKIKDDYELKLVVCHLDHSLRGEESLRDSNFTREIARKYNLPFELAKKDVSKIAKEENLSIETCARMVRYDFFNSLLDKYPNSLLATAHNMNDQCETIIQRFMRGTSLKGLSGISPKRDRFIRPLLAFKREEIEAYLKENKLSFVTDSTNLTDDYGRNKIRNNIIPYIEENFNESIIESLAHFGERIRQEDDFLEDLALSSYKKYQVESGRGYIKFHKDLRDIHKIIIKRVIILAMEELLGSREDIYSKAINDSLDILFGETGRMVDLARGLKVRNNYGELIISKGEGKNNFIDNRGLLERKKIKVKLLGEPQTIPFGDYKITLFKSEGDNPVKGRVTLSADNLKEVTIRTRKEGDRIKALGMRGYKRVKSIFIDKKIDRVLRDTLPLIEDDNGEIIYLHPDIISEDRKITENTKEIMYIYIEGIN